MSRAQIFLAGLIAGALIATALFWFQGPPLDVRQTVDSTQRDVAVFDSANTIREQLDSAAHQTLNQSQALRQRLTRAADTANARADTLRGLLDSVQADADSIRRVAQAADDARQDAIDSLRALTALLEGERQLILTRWQAADSLLTVAQRSLHDALGRLERVAAKVRPRCGLAVFGGLGFRGLDAGAGVACRL